MEATISKGDLSDLSSLERAYQGIDTVISAATLTSSRTQEDTIAAVDNASPMNLVDAAAKDGVSNYSYVSMAGNCDIPNPFLTAKRAVERHIIDSGASYAVLRPNCFMEFWLAPMGGFGYPNHKTTIHGDGKNPLSWTSKVDVARFAVMAIDSPVARNIIVELCWPDKLSPDAALRAFEESGG